jgi:hypothetical protein
MTIDRSEPVDERGLADVVQEEGSAAHSQVLRFRDEVAGPALLELEPQLAVAVPAVRAHPPLLLRQHVSELVIAALQHQGALQLVLPAHPDEQVVGNVLKLDPGSAQRPLAVGADSLGQVAA